MDSDINFILEEGGETSKKMQKTSHYFRTIVAFHNLRERAKETVESWHERSLADRVHDGWNNTRRAVASKTRNFFSHPENAPCEHIPEKYSYVFRPKSRWELIQLSGTVCGIEFCYAAETAFVTPILLSLGLSIKFVTMIWCLSPLVGLFLTPILGSMSDSWESKFGRRRPFVIMYSIGILLGLILVPNGHHIGLALGDEPNKEVKQNMIIILNGTNDRNDTIGLQNLYYKELLTLNQSKTDLEYKNNLENLSYSGGIISANDNLKNTEPVQLSQLNDEDISPFLMKYKLNSTKSSEIVDKKLQKQFDEGDTFPDFKNFRINLESKDEPQDPADDFSKLVDKKGNDFESDSEEDFLLRNKTYYPKIVVSRNNDEDDVNPSFYGVETAEESKRRKQPHAIKDEFSRMIDKEESDSDSKDSFIDENNNRNSKPELKNNEIEHSRIIDDEDIFPNLRIKSGKNISNKNISRETSAKFSKDVDSIDVYPIFQRLNKRSVLKSDDKNNQSKESYNSLSGKSKIFDSEINKRRSKRSSNEDGQKNLFPSDSVTENHIQSWSVAFTVIGTILLDFCSDACQSPSRTYLLDVSLPSDHAAGLSTFTVMAGLGGSIGYAMGALHWETTFIGQILGGQVNAVFMIVNIIFIICVVTTVISFPEIPLSVLKDPKMYKEYQEKFRKEPAQENEMVVINTRPKRYGSTDESNDIIDKIETDQVKEEASTSGEQLQTETEENGSYQSEKDITEKISGESNICVVDASQNTEKNFAEELSSSNEHPTLKEYLFSIIHMPNSLRILCLTNLFCWMSLVCYSLYFTDFVGECVYKGNPQAPDGSPSKKLYDDGVSFGCWGMALYSISCSVYSIFIDTLIKKIGARPVYIGGQLVYSFGMVIMAITRHKATVILLSPTAGIMYSTLFTMPYLLIAHYHSSNQFSDGKKGTNNKMRGIGTDVAAVSSMVFLSQFVLSLSMGSIVEAIGSNVVPVCAAALLSALGALSATQVTYLDI